MANGREHQRRTKIWVYVVRVNGFESKSKTVRKSQEDPFVYVACLALRKCRGKKKRDFFPRMLSSQCVLFVVLLIVKTITAQSTHGNVSRSVVVSHHRPTRQMLTLAKKKARILFAG